MTKQIKNIFSPYFNRSLFLLQFVYSFEFLSKKESLVPTLSIVVRETLYVYRQSFITLLKLAGRLQ